MLVLEAVAGLWFWAQLASLWSLPHSGPNVLPAMVAAERAWHSPDAAWSEAQRQSWRWFWAQRTGCCVDFVTEPDHSDCRNSVRVVQAKTLDGPDGLRTAYVLAACG